MKYFSFIFSREEKGFTLIEMMLSVVIFVVVILSFSRAMTFFAANQGRVKRQDEIVNEINNTLYNISYNIRMARNPAEDIFPVMVDEEGRTLIVYLEEIDSNKMRQIVYKLVDDTLVREWNLSTNESYPYSFDETEGQNRMVLLRGVLDEEIFIDESNVDIDEENRNIRRINIEITVDNSGINEASSMTVISRNR